MKELEILQEYSSESYFDYNSLRVTFLDTPICFVVSFDISNEKTEKYLEQDDIDLEYLIKNSKFKNGLVVNNITIEIKTHENSTSYLYYIFELYYELYQVIPNVNIISDDLGYCPYYSLFYEIKLPNGTISIPFLNDLKARDNEFADFYYLDFMEKYYEIIGEDGWQEGLKHINAQYNEIKNISLQTKTRRLGYIKMILNMFNTSNYYPANIFNKKIEFEAKKYNHELLDYINNKGIIDITKTGNSSKPYVNASIALNLLYVQNNSYKLSKYGKIFNILNKKLNKKLGNNFKLTNLQKSYFLYFILKNDGLYLWVLLDLIYFQGNKTTFKNLKKVFQNYLLQQLQFELDSCNLSFKCQSKIAAKIKKIKEWKKPEVYLEHIIEPRINWLLDLDLLDSKEFIKKNIILSDKGLILLSCLISYMDIFLEKYAIIDHLECMDFFGLTNQIYKNKAVAINDKDFNLVDEYISESFYLFKTMAPNRVTASQAILYTCFMMLFKEKVVVNFCTIQHYLKSSKNKKFIFEWYKTEKDGSIRKKREYI